MSSAAQIVTDRMQLSTLVTCICESYHDILVYSVSETWQLWILVLIGEDIVAEGWKRVGLIQMQGD